MLKKKKEKTLKIHLLVLMVSVFREIGYDGIVLESWSRWAAYGILHDPKLRILVSVDLH